MIVSCVTEGIIVTAQPRFVTKRAGPGMVKHIFSYHIRIENESSYTVQLKKRHWIIFDTIGQISEVKGDGVIGKQPVLAQGEVHEYDSWSTLISEIGYMEGHYLLERKENGSSFLAKIPRFQLIVPYRLN